MERNRRNFLQILALALTLTIVVVSLHPAKAATITVNTTADELNDDEDCSLREAIQAANTNTDVGACPAGGVGVVGGGDPGASVIVVLLADSPSCQSPGCK